MSVPADQMPAMGGTMPAPGDPDAGAAPASAPMGSPMSTPEPAEGQKQAAIVNVQMAINMLEQAIPALGSSSDEGSTVLTALKSLSKKFGASKSQDLIPAELQMLMQNAQQTGGAPGQAATMPGATPGASPVPPTGGM